MDYQRCDLPMIIDLQFLPSACFFFVLKHLSALVIFPLDLRKHCPVVFHDGVRCRRRLLPDSDSHCRQKKLLQGLEEEDEWIKLGRSLRA